MLNDNDILFLAFRYALGRRTYIVSDMVEVIIDKWETLPITIKSMIQKEIKYAIMTNNAGADIDIKDWKTILELNIKE